MEQKIIVSENIVDFEQQVNRFLKEGWMVVNGSLQTNLATAAVGSFSDGLTSVVTKRLCSVVLSKTY